MSESILLLALGLVAVIVFLIYQYLSWHLNVWKKLGVAGPAPKLLYGSYPSIIDGKKHTIYEYDEIYNEYKKQHRAIGVFLTRNPELMVLDPKLAHEIIVTNFSKYRDNLSSKWVIDKKLDKIAAKSPFLATGEDWKPLRTNVLGGVTQNKLNLAYPIWKASAEKLGKFLREKTKEGSAILDTKDFCYRFTADILGDFLWGIDALTFTNSTEPNTIMQMGTKMISQLFATVGLYFSMSLVPFLKRFGDNRLFPAETDNFFSQLTKDAIALRLSDGIKKNRVDFLNHMIQLQDKKQATHDEIVSNMMTVMLDGYETSAALVYHTLLYLAYHTDVQEKLRTELFDSIEADEPLTYDKLDSLPYLDQCVQETIRIITPIPFFGRICTESTEMEVDVNHKVPIKVGTIVMIPVFSYHHDPDYFPQPFDYKPERFDNGLHEELTKQGIYMPFGTGPRICIGMRLGLFEIKTALVEILKTYRVKCCAKTMPLKKPDSNSFILGLDGEFWLEYERLNNSVPK